MTEIPVDALNGRDRGDGTVVGCSEDCWLPMGEDGTSDSLSSTFSSGSWLGGEVGDGVVLLLLGEGEG